MMPCSGPSAAAFIAWLTSSTLVSRLAVKVRSVAEPFGTGTRSAYPSSLPFSSGSTRPIALAAPVEVGTMLIAAALARRRSRCGPSCRFWSWVYAWIVVIRPRSMVNASCRTFAIGARQLVVQDAFEIIVCAVGSYLSSLTPMTIVMSSFLAGAEMITFFAPPAMCALAFSASVNSPVDSSTTSAPRSRHGSLLGSRSTSTLNVWPPTLISSALAFTSCGSRPRMLSYLSRCASTALSVRSLTPTSWMSAPRASAARKKLRPIRPKPLMPTRIVTGHLLAAVVVIVGRHAAPASSPNSANQPYPRPLVRPAGGSGVHRQHLGGDGRLGVRYPQIARPLVGQREQPADPAGDRVLGQRRVAERPQFLQRRLAVLQPQLPGAGQMVRGVVAEDLQGAGDPGSGGHRGARRAAQIGVVEVGQPVRGGTDLPADPPFLPGQHAGMRAQPGEQVRDRVAVLDHHAVHAAYIAGLRGDPDPPGGAHQRQRRLRAGAGDLQRARAPGLGQRTVRHERATPGGHRAAHARRHHVRRQATHRAAAHVQQAGLPREGLAVLDHPHDVVAALAQAAGGQHVDLTRVPVDLGDLPAQPAGDVAGVQLGLDDHATGDDVQPAGEAQQRRHLRAAAARLGYVDPAELVLDRSRHRHRLVTSRTPCHLSARRPVSLTGPPPVPTDRAAARRPRPRPGRAPVGHPAILTHDRPVRGRRPPSRRQVLHRRAGQVGNG